MTSAERALSRDRFLFSLLSSFVKHCTLCSAHRSCPRNASCTLNATGGGREGSSELALDLVEPLFDSQGGRFEK